jgi:hypothetical protein
MGHATSTLPVTLEKIVDAGLRSFALSSGQVDRQSVIVELAGPARVPTRSNEVPRREAPTRHGRLVKKGPAAAPTLTPHGTLMDELESQIAGRVSPRFVRLNAAEAFVLDVTPDQLRALCDLRLVGTVRPNRVRRA